MKVVAAGHRLCNHSVSHDTAVAKKPVAYQGSSQGEPKRAVG